MTEPAPTAAPAAATTPTAPSFDARLKAAQEMTKRPVVADAEETTDATTSQSDEGTVADASELTATGEADGTEEATDTAAADGTESGDETPLGTAEERLTSLNEALAKWDVAAIKKALPGVKIPEKVEAAFRALSKRQDKVSKAAKSLEAERQKAIAEITAETQKLTALQRHGTEKFKPAVDAQVAWENQDYVSVAKALEKQFKTDIATLTQKLASGKQGMTPEEKSENAKIAALEKKLADLEAKKADEGQKQTRAQQRQQAVAKVGEVLKGHKYVTDDDSLNEVFSAYEACWNGEKFTKTPKQVADELQAKVLARAKKLGLAPAAVAAPVKKPVTKTPPKRLPEPPAGGVKAHADSFEARLALAQRKTEQQRRGLMGK